MYPPPACRNVPKAQGSLPRAATAVRTPYAYLPRVCRTYRAPVVTTGKDQPLDCIVFLFYVSKVFQFGSLFGYYFAIGPLPSLASISLFRLVLGLQLEP